MGYRGLMLQFAAMSGRQEQELELASQSEAETIDIGRRIGRGLAAGDLVLLLAPFGAGKTHLAKGIAAGLGADPDEVNSPSFVLINEYVAGQERGRIPIYHADLYRIETDHDLATSGLEECFNGDGVCLIEWAERAAGALPDERLAIHISETGEKSRRLRLVPHGPRYAALVAALAAERNDAAGD